MRTRLDTTAVRASLADLNGWELEGDDTAISKSFKFRNFSEAFAFMTRTALAAEQLDHHPDWSNVFNRVEISLTTHSVGGLTELDFELARQIDNFAKS